ncbi:hypothetical protein [Tropicibacter oceani]|uniref:4Fe-4S ferredoxin-type domain-containing protein n=1 Tax=Tropicibacter oceani TaxID=3058420 RepID=A0ABY8QCN6_9RHOB|nr:hypothetical protein [Tropicibacter oceani]WGW02381.1 hypothetical protein QF118_10500 [Tropicibacter oceani]
MQSDRLIGHAPRTAAMGQQLTTIQGPCIGCKGCQGLCQALIEAMSVPDVVLGRDG